MCFLYIVGSSFTIISETVPSSSMCMVSSMSACRKAPGMSDTTTYLFSLASIAHDNIIASIDTVGELVSSLLVYILCGLPSAHPLAFIVPSLFSLRNIRYLSAFFLSSYDKSFLLHGISACRVCSCFISFRIALSPLFPNALSPSLILSWVIMTCACVFGSTIDCSSDCVSVNCTFFFGLGHRSYLAFVLISVSSFSAFSFSLLLAFISNVIFMSSIVT